MRLMYERQEFAPFCTVDGLSQKSGVSTWDLPAIVLKELVDNALDALDAAGKAESAAALCQVGLLSPNGFYVQDQGEGIDPDNFGNEFIAELFSIGRLLK